MAYKFNPFTGNFDQVGSGSGSTAGVMTTLFDHYTDAASSGTSETDLYSDTIAAGQLASNGDKIFFSYFGTTTTNATIRVYFGGTDITDSNISTANGGGFANEGWNISGFLIRVNSTTVRAILTMDSGVSSDTDIVTLYKEITGLTLSNTQILKISGEIGSGTVTAKGGSVSYQSAV